MQHEHEDVLKNSRDDKIKSLGFLCYNLYVDEAMRFAEMDSVVDDIRKANEYLTTALQSGDNPEWINKIKSVMNEKLIELGCICYNLYIDKKLVNANVLELCDSISLLSHEITGGQSEPEVADSLYTNKHTTQSELKVTCPYGMEPIPPDYRKCRCGYRNKNEARYCGKCGSRLP